MLPNPRLNTRYAADAFVSLFKLAANYAETSSISQCPSSQAPELFRRRRLIAVTSAPKGAPGIVVRLARQNHRLGSGFLLPLCRHRALASMPATPMQTGGSGSGMRGSCAKSNSWRRSSVFKISAWAGADRSPIPHRSEPLSSKEIRPRRTSRKHGN